MDEINFKDFIKLQRGFDLPKNKRKIGKIPVVASTSITGYHNEFKVKAYGVVTGRSGALGKVQYIKEDFWPLNTSLWVKDFKGNDPRYVYYFLKTLDLKRFNSGAGVPTLNRNDLDSYKINVHRDKISQKKIVGILSPYDDLIENNNKRIKTLEEMAQKIYKHWFVDFKFPGHKNTKFIDSELGKIPEGWELAQLESQLVKLESGKRPKGGIVANQSNGVPSIGAENVNGISNHNFSNEKLVPKEFFLKMNKGKVFDRAVAIYKDGAYIGRSTYFRDGFPHSECCVNEHVFLLQTKEEKLTQNLLYLWLQDEATISNLRATNTNAAQPGLNQQSINTVKITLPEAKIAKLFDSYVEPIFLEIIALAKKNRNLVLTRNILLGKLISGKISVEGLEVKI